MSEIFDITLTITPELVTWPGDPAVTLERVSKIEEGKNANVSRLDLGVHTGTHLDAPFHFIPGAKTVESLPLEILTGPVQVVELPDNVEMITMNVLKEAGIKTGVTRLLLKTRNSQYWKETAKKFHTDFVGVLPDGADYLIQLGIKLVGIDYLSIAPFKKSRPTHERLLNSEIIIVEGLDLSRITPGDYMLYCLPLKLGGSDGAPARVILVR
jgi:arylformamidase